MRLLLFIAIVAGPAVAFAAGGGHHVNLDPEINWWRWDVDSPPVGWFLVNFVIFVALLVKLLGKKLNQAFADRSTSIKTQVETNERELKEASDEREQWKTRLAGIEQESKELIENSKADGERQKDKIVESAKEYAERLRNDTGVIMEQEAASAQRSLQLEVSLQALEKAEAMLRGSITDADRVRLFEQAVAQLADGKTEISTGAGEPAVAGGAP